MYLPLGCNFRLAAWAIDFAWPPGGGGCTLVNFWLEEVLTRSVYSNNSKYSKYVNNVD